MPSEIPRMEIVFTSSFLCSLKYNLQALPSAEDRRAQNLLVPKAHSAPFSKGIVRFQMSLMLLLMREVN